MRVGYAILAIIVGVGAVIALPFRILYDIGDDWISSWLRH